MVQYGTMTRLPQHSGARHPTYGSDNSVPNADDVARLARRLRNGAVAAGYRRLILLVGDAEWTVAGAVAALRAAFDEPSQSLWVGTGAPSETMHCAPNGLSRYLGSEVDALVINARSGLDPDGLGAGTGAVRAGGLIFLLTPPLADWPAAPDPEAERLAVDGYGAAALGQRFITRLARVLAADPTTVTIEQHQPLPRPKPVMPGMPPKPSADPDCATADQARAVAAILRTGTGHRRRPTVLVADRGRGKSAALGIAAARFLRQRGGEIIITGPRRAAVDAALRHAADGLGALITQGRITTQAGGIRFMLPEDLLAADETPALVLVDEAAALPTATLTTLLQRHSRIVFATTVHGYEGTGGGFRLRFQPVIEATAPHGQTVTLAEPVRWHQGDPVEALLFRALLLDAELPAPAAPPDSTALSLETVDRDALLDDEPLLRELFGLLVHAHYRTRPLDLRNLLDGPNVALHMMRAAGRVIAVAMVAAEGGFDEPMARAIWAGKRRPRGHLLPQSLAVQAGVVTGARLHAIRIMRIAVHPALQGKGIGTAMMNALAARASEEGFDAIGANFGATPALLAYWRKADCLPLRLGIKRDAASGTHSAVVLRALNARGDEVLQAARQQMTEDFPAQLADPLRHVEPAIVLALLQGLSVPAPSVRDWAETAAFACGNRAYEVSVRALRNLSLVALARPGWRQHLNATERTVMVARIIQQRPWGDTAAVSELTGRPAVLATLRAALREIIVSKAPTAIIAHLEALGVAP